MSVGAQIAIKELQHRKAVSRLLLGHNHLGDEGTECLFKFLSSPDGQVFRISELALNSNEIGDKGLRAISRYLTEAGPGALVLRELFLQGVRSPSSTRSVLADIQTSSYTDRIYSHPILKQSLSSSPH